VDLRDIKIGRLTVGLCDAPSVSLGRLGRWRIADNRRPNTGGRPRVGDRPGFVDAMHGTFTLDDTPGGGLTATMPLPLAADEAGTDSGV
jgi:hypothetical protein